MMFMLILFFSVSLKADVFIPMDESQTDHLKAYGVVYRMLEKGSKCHWLLNYMGGSFIIEDDKTALEECGNEIVACEAITESRRNFIISKTNESGGKDVILEKAPKIAVYSPPGKEPWDDAVTLVLDYTKIPYAVIYDKEILMGKIYEYEWLHLHHEDFTGQFDRFYLNSLNQSWLIGMIEFQKTLSKELGYSKYWMMKRDVAKEISNYVKRGGFLFSMCSGTNTLDDALALSHQDIIPALLDGDGTIEPKLDYSNTFAFTAFKMNSAFSIDIDDINYEPEAKLYWENEKFTLTKFSPQTDPVEAMLTQNHTLKINEFLGRTTTFRKDKLKQTTVILGDAFDNKYAKYIHGAYGEGFFTFLAGHDPEDFVHYVNDPPTDLQFYKHSPGYRLILNNVLFPASQEKKKKT
ncbi:MAG: asparagine synthetase B [bacterium]